MQCFQTLGTAWDRQSLEEMEAVHVCAFQIQGTPSPAEPGRMEMMRSEAQLLRDALRMHAWVLILLTVLALYLLPTALEFAASRALNPWLAVILPGDLFGCAVMIGLLRCRAPGRSCT